MGVLPLQFKGRDSAESLGIKGDEEFDILGLEGDIKPQQDVTLTVKRSDGSHQEIKLILRIDTPIEVDYYRNGGILPYVLREILKDVGKSSAAA
jgi:aconitate hydratase